MQKYINNSIKSQSKLSTSQEISVLFGLDSGSKAHWRACRAAQVTVVVKPADHTKNPQTITLPVWQVSDYLSRRLSYDDFDDCHVWVSQNVFNAERSTGDVAAFTSCYLDIDAYKCDWGKGKSADRLARDFVEICRFNDVPVPSLINFSGQGLQVKWLFERPLSPKAAPRWNAVQAYLLKKFAEFGADPQSIDAARILRVVGSKNPKPGAKGAVCRTVFVNRDDENNVVRHDFELLCETVLPYSREQVREWKQARAERVLKRQETASQNVQRHKNPRCNTAVARLRDLATLRQVRYPNGKVTEGERMKFLFWELNYACLAGLVSLSDFDAYAVEKAAQIDGTWRFGEAELGTLKKKFDMSLKGETTKENRIPLYTPRRTKLIQIFEITPEEQANLSTLCSQAQQREKANDKRRQQYGAAESLSRADRHQRALARADRARELKRSGLSIRAIAREMRLSVSTVHSYLSDSKESTASLEQQGELAQTRLFGFRSLSNGVTLPLGGCKTRFYEKKTSASAERAQGEARRLRGGEASVDDSVNLREKFYRLRAEYDDLRLISQLLGVDFKVVLKLDMLGKLN